MPPAPVVEARLAHRLRILKRITYLAVLHAGKRSGTPECRVRGSLARLDGRLLTAEIETQTVLRLENQEDYNGR